MSLIENLRQTRSKMHAAGADPAQLCALHKRLTSLGDNTPFSIDNWSAEVGRYDSNYAKSLVEDKRLVIPRLDL